MEVQRSFLGFQKIEWFKSTNLLVRDTTIFANFMILN